MHSFGIFSYILLKKKTQILTGWITISEPCFDSTGFSPSKGASNEGSALKKWGNDIANGISKENKKILNLFPYLNSKKKKEKHDKLTVIAGCNVAQTFFQALLIGTKTRWIWIIHITIESLFMQFKIIGFKAIHSTGMRINYWESSTKGFTINPKGFTFGYIARKQCAIISALNTIAIG